MMPHARPRSTAHWPPPRFHVQIMNADQRGVQRELLFRPLTGHVAITEGLVVSIMPRDTNKGALF